MFVSDCASNSCICINENITERQWEIVEVKQKHLILKDKGGTQVDANDGEITIIILMIIIRLLPVSSTDSWLQSCQLQAEKVILEEVIFIFMRFLVPVFF